MAVLKMQKIHICALKSNRKEILEELQRSGLIQVITEQTDDDVFQKTDTTTSRSECEKFAQMAAQALNVLDEYAPVKRGMLASLEGKRTVSLADYNALAAHQQENLDLIDRVLGLQRTVAENQANVQRTAVQIESLTPWMGLDVPLNYTGTAKTRAFIGTLPAAYTLEQVYAMLAQAAPQLDAYSVEVLGTEKDLTCLFAVCTADAAGQMEDALRQNGFARPVVQSSQTPGECKIHLQQEMEQFFQAADAAAETLAGMGSSRERLEFLADYYTMRAERYAVLGELPQSAHVFFLSGYVAEKNAAALQASLSERYSCSVELEDIPEEEPAPVLLQNNGFSAPTEGVVESYSLPNRREFDPTSIMAIFYYFMFGLMLSDAAYGLIMFIGCLVVLKKFPNMNAGTKKMMQMFCYCGVSTMFWGVMFGSYFGDAITVIADTFFGKSVTIPAVWFVPLDNPIRMLIYCFLFGLIHLFAGLILKGYLLLRQKQTMDFICDVVLWFLLLIGLLLLLLPSQLFESISQMHFAFPPFVVLLGKVFAIVGAIGIILMGGRPTKSVGKRLAKGAYELYGATSWLSDVLSYSRLLALGLATGVMASVFNSLGSMMGASVGGVILFVVVFLVGHVFNLAINLLGAYVHTNRLQFVEFFGKFYEGGGKAFRPFAATTKYISIKEEK